MRVPSNAPAIGRAEVAAAAAVFRTGALTSASHEGGEQVRRFESLSASYTGSRFSVAVNSGTAALQAALLALGVGRGDDVLIPSFTFVATANAVLSVGARPVFVDILQDGSYTMDPADLEARMTPRAKAVVPVHLYGNVARMGEILAVAKRRGARVVEDAAQALGSTLGGRHAGAFGDIGCYSLYPAKVMTAGEGGFAVTDRPRLRDRMRMARNHGMPPSGRGRGALALGLNLRMPEAAAAVASVQIAKLPRFLSMRRRNAERLTRLLGGLNVVLPSPRAGERVNWYLYTVSAGRRRNALARKLNAAGFGVAVYYPVPVHRMPLYREAPGRRPGRPLPATMRAARTVLSLPVHPGVSAADLKRMARVTRSVVGPS